jgi:hypothetical protein
MKIKKLPDFCTIVKRNIAEDYRTHIMTDLLEKEKKFIV